jgi:hypothetical protein
VYALLLLLSPDVAALGADPFAAREAAQARLRARGPWAAPQLLLGLHSPDAEVRERCRRAAPAWLLEARADLQTFPLASRLFYGPDECKGGAVERYLSDASNRRVRDMGPLVNARLHRWARRFGLLGPDEPTDFERALADGSLGAEPWAYYGWVNVMRWRAVGSRHAG